MQELQIPIKARQRVTVTLDEMGGRVVTLRPISGRMLALQQRLTANPGEVTLLLDVAGELLGTRTEGDGGLTREEVESLSLDAIEQVIVLARKSMAELEAAARKDEAP